MSERKTDVTLVNCPSPGKFQGAPNGLLTVSAGLKEAGFSVQVVDPCLYHEGPSEQVVLDALARSKPTLVGITDYSPFHFDVLQLAQLVKIHSPDLIVGVGGWHPTFLSGSVERYPFIDYEIRGDGEYPLVEFLRYLQGDRDNAVIPGLTFRDEQGVIQNNPYIVKRRTKWPSPDRSYLEETPDIYNLSLFGGKRSAQTMTYRGCSFACDFCPVSNFDTSNGLPGPRSIECVSEELESLRRSGVEAVFIDDPTFTMNYKRAVQIADILAENQMEWACQTRVDRMPPEVLEQMAKSGCSYVFIGFETAEGVTLDLMKKKTNPNMNWRAIENATEVGIRVGISMMAGYPGQPDEEVILNVRKVASLPQKQMIIVSPALFSIYPGTEQWVKAIKAGIVRNDSYDSPYSRGYPWKWFDEGEGGIHVPGMTPERAARLYKEAQDILEGRIY